MQKVRTSNPSYLLGRFEHRFHVPLEEVDVRLVASPVWEGDDLAFLRVESLTIANSGRSGLLTRSRYRVSTLR